MSKPTKSVAKTEFATIKSISYRAERISTFGWQGYKITVFSDNTYREEAVGKEDILELVMTRIGKAIRAEGEKTFLETKRKAANV